MVNWSRVPVLAYHRVNDLHNDGLSIGTEQFRAHLACLKKMGFVSRTLSEVYHMISTRSAELGKTVVITFDDGYADNYLYALPILQEFGFTATFFVTTGFVGAGRLFPWDATKPWTTIYGADYCMNWNQIACLAEHGFEIGSHTVTHRELTGLSLSEVREELVTSMRQIEDKVGRRVDSFCYPRGRFDMRIRDLVHESGYKVAVVTPGSLSGPPSKDDPLRVQRIGLYRNDGERELRLKMSKVWRMLARNHLGGTVRVLRRLFSH